MIGMADNLIFDEQLNDWVPLNLDKKDQPKCKNCGQELSKYTKKRLCPNCAMIAKEFKRINDPVFV
jgi:rubrerythrin